MPATKEDILKEDIIEIKAGIKYIQKEVEDLKQLYKDSIANHELRLRQVEQEVSVINARHKDQYFTQTREYRRARLWITLGLTIFTAINALFIVFKI